MFKFLRLRSLSFLAQTQHFVIPRFRKLENYKESLKHLLQALQIDQDLYKEDHPYLIRDLHSLGKSYLAIANQEKAMEYLTQALDMAKRKLISTHPKIQKIQKTLNKLYNTENSTAKANQQDPESVKDNMTQ